MVRNPVRLLPFSRNENQNQKESEMDFKKGKDGGMDVNIGSREEFDPQNIGDEDASVIVFNGRSLDLYLANNLQVRTLLAAAFARAVNQNDKYLRRLATQMGNEVSVTAFMRELETMFGDMAAEMAVADTRKPEERN